MVLSFTITLLIFLIAGLFPLFIQNSKIELTKSDVSNYHLGGRTISGLMAGVSSATTSNSAFMFVAMIPLVVFGNGFWAWLLIGWTLGIASTWIFIYPKLKRQFDKGKSETYLDFVAGSVNSKKLLFKRFSAILTVIFLGIYASGQLVAANSTLNVLLGDISWTFVIVAIIIVLTYSSIGGLRSTIYSDFVQALAVILGAILLFWGIKEKLIENTEASPFLYIAKNSFQDLFSKPIYSTILFIFGWALGGFFEFGQPHVMVRILALKNEKQIKIGTITYLIWFIVLSALVISIGYLIKSISTLPEYSMILKSSQDKLFGQALSLFLEPWQIGLCLAGFLAATLSTADSQILSASAAIGVDWSKKGKVTKRKHLQLWTVLIGVTSFILFYIVNALGLGVYKIITLSWALVSAAFVPPCIMLLTKRKVSVFLMIFGALAGVCVSAIWGMSSYANFLFEGVPGVLTSLIILLIGSKKNR